MFRGVLAAFAVMLCTVASHLVGAYASAGVIEDDSLLADEPIEAAASTPPVGTLEVPQPGSDQSGVGVVTGWVCDAEKVTVVIDGVERQAAYGTRRSDTQQACGDTNNGFGYLVNWNLLGDGPHQVEVLADDVPIGSADITVATLGAPFRTGLSGRYDLP